MSSKVNTSFVVLLVGAILGLTGLSAGTYYWFIVRKDPKPYIARGDAFVQQKKYDEALEQYAKGAARSKGNLDYLMKVVETAEMIQVPAAGEKPKEMLGLIQGQLNYATTLYPSDAKVFQRLMQHYMDLSENVASDLGIWEQVYKRCVSMLQANKEMLLARKYRGIAQINRMRFIDVAPEEKDLARQDLLAWLEKNPQDAQALVSLSHWHIQAIQQIERSGIGKDRLPALRQQARQFIDKLAQLPADQGQDHGRRQLDRIRLLLEAGDTAPAMTLLARMESEQLAKPDSKAALMLADLLARYDRQPVDRGASLGPTTQGLQRAYALLNAAIKLDTENIQLMNAIGQVQSQQRLLDEGIATFDRIRQVNLIGKPMEVIGLQRLQAVSHLQYADLLLNKIETIREAAARQELIKKIQEAIETCTPIMGKDSAPLNILQGKLALAQGEYALATIKLDRATSQMKESTPELLLLSARARFLAGEPGGAAERLIRLLDLNPTNLALRAELTRLQLQMRQDEAAKQNIDRLLAEQPNDPGFLRLKAAWLAQTDKPDQAIALYQKLDPTKNADLRGPLAGLYLQTGKKAQARQLLEGLFQADPKDIRTLQILLRTVEDKLQAKAYVDQARQAGADEQALDLLTGVLDKSKTDVSETLEQIVNKDTDPISRALRRHSLFLQTDRQDEAEKELAQAAQLGPENPQVILAQFNMALMKQDWNLAQSKVSKAASLNLDLAQGLFLQGQLAVAKNEYAKAAGHFQNGLKIRPVYSDGWRELADVQRMMGDINESVASYRRALSERPNNVAALRGLAMSLDQQDHFRDALENLRLAAEYAANDRLTLSQYLAYEEEHGEPARSLARRQEIQLAVPQDMDNNRAIAILLARTGKKPQAIQAIQELLQKNPDDLANLAAYVSVLVAIQEPDKAQKAIEDYLARRGDRAVANDWLLLAKFHLSQNQDEATLSAFRKAVAVEDKKTRPASRELADLMFDRGLFNDALEYYQALHEADPRDQRIAQRYIEALMRAKKIDLADQVLKRLLENHPNDATNWILAGMVARSRNDDEKALESFRKATQLGTAKAMTHFQYAEQLSMSPGREKQAVEVLNKALERDPNLAPARLLMASLRLRQNDHREAIRELQFLLTQQPKLLQARMMLFNIYLNNDMTPQLLTFLDESAKLMPRDSRWLRMQAREAVKQNRPDDAEKKLRQAVIIEPKLAENHYELAKLMLEGKRAADVQKMLEGGDVKPLAQMDPMLMGCLAQSLADQGQKTLAKEAFLRALGLCRNLVQITSVADQMAQSLDLDLAIQSLESMAIGPVRLPVQLAIMGLEAGHNRFAQVLDRFKSLEPDLQQKSDERRFALRMQALALHRTSQFEQAKLAYQALLEADPDNVPNLNNLAYLLAQNLNQPQEAIKHAKKAAKLAPNDPQVLDTLGWTQFKAGQKGESLNTLSRSVEISALAANQYHLGEVMLSIPGQDRRQAIRYMEKSRELAEKTKDDEILQQVTQRLTALK